MCEPGYSIKNGCIGQGTTHPGPRSWKATWMEITPILWRRDYFPQKIFSLGSLSEQVYCILYTYAKQVRGKQIGFVPIFCQFNFLTPFNFLSITFLSSLYTQFEVIYLYMIADTGCSASTVCVCRGTTSRIYTSWGEISPKHSS